MESNPEKKYEVTESLMNDVLNYLATKPYQEVYQLVGKILQLGRQLNVPKSEELKKEETEESKKK